MPWSMPRWPSSKAWTSSCIPTPWCATSISSARHGSYRHHSGTSVFHPGQSRACAKGCSARCTTCGSTCLDMLEGRSPTLWQFLGKAETHQLGRQHEVDQRYLNRIEALNFTIQHDDGQSLDTVDEAEVILVGASRTSKTPTCVYLAIRGIRAANISLVPGMALPPCCSEPDKPMVVGLWVSPDRLVQVQPQPAVQHGRGSQTPTISIWTVCAAEIAATRKLFEQQELAGDRCVAALDRGNRGGGDKYAERTASRTREGIDPGFRQCGAAGLAQGRRRGFHHIAGGPR